MSENPKAVFLSYASQDAEAAKRICDALRGAGVEVWFDAEGGLEHGDEWDAKIRRQIKECVLFIAVISANTQAREEGYFRLEWELAAQRALSIASGVAFILPVVIDGTKEPEALVPDRFRAVQWTKLPGGAVPPEVLQRFLKLWSHRTGALKALQGGRLPPAIEPGTLPPVKPARRWWPVMVAAGVLAAIAAGWLFMRPGPAPSRAGVAANPPAAAPAKPEWPRDADLRRAYQLVNQINSIREDLLLAEEVAKKVVEKAPSDPEAVTVLAHIESTILNRNFDFTADRTAIARRYCERAVQLAPEDPVALAALATFLTQRGGDHPRAEELLRRAIALDPAESRYVRSLAAVVGRQNGAAGAAAALKLLEEAATRFPQDALIRYNIANQYRDAGDYEKAERLLDAAIAIAPIANAIDWKARYALMRGDLAATKAALDRVPPRMQAEERSVLTRVAYALFSGNVGDGLNAVTKYAEPWFFDISNFTGPRSLLIGALREREGNGDLARAHYEAALMEIRRYREEHPADPGAHAAEAWALLGLGRVDEARAAHRISVAGAPRPMRFFAGGLWWFYAHARVFLLEDRERILTMVRELAEVPEARAPLLRRIRMDPRLASFHHDPEIVAILAPTVAGGAPATAAPPDDKSVAVLAFANLSDDKANEYFSDGISEELLNVLAKVSGLKVSARTSAFYFKGKGVSVPEVARQLGVAYVVDGSVRKSGDKVRITAQLIKAVDGFQVWSDTFTRDLKDIFAVQDEIAGLIAKNLQLKMGMATARPSVDLEAYQEYLAGKAAYAKAGMPELREAVVHLERAVAIDPKFAPAWVQLASAHTRLGRWGGTPTIQAWAAARAAIDRARALDPDSPDMLVALGWILRTAEWDWAGAEQAFRQALRLRPGHADTLASAAVLLFNIGRGEEAFRFGQQAAQLDPLNAGTQIDLALMFHFNGNWAESERAARRALALAPTGVSYHAVLAWNLMQQQRYAEAEQEIALEADATERLAAAGLLALKRGNRAAAGRCLEELEALARNNPDAADLQTSITWISAGLGDKDRAFAALARARASRDPSISWLRNGAYGQPLVGDPRWPEFLRSVGLADEQLK